MEKVVLTLEGYNKLAEDLHFLKTKKRREVAAQLEFARSLGDLRENAEYETAKEAKHQLEIRIGELEAKLANAKIIDLSDLPEGKAVIGCTVELKNLTTGKNIIYRLVTHDEADFNAGKISITSPIGQGLVGRVLQETVEIQVPAGKVRFQILRIERGV